MFSPSFFLLRFLLLSMTYRMGYPFGWGQLSWLCGLQNPYAPPAPQGQGRAKQESLIWNLRLATAERWCAISAVLITDLKCNNIKLLQRHYLYPSQNQYTCKVQAEILT